MKRDSGLADLLLMPLYIMVGLILLPYFLIVGIYLQMKEMVEDHTTKRREKE